MRSSRHSSHPASGPAPVQFARPDELTAGRLYDLLRLRVDVFVVEQECPYPDLDGHDLDPGTVHAWIEEDGEVVAAARVLRGSGDGTGADSARVGRVVTRADRRGRGYGERLVSAVLDRVGAVPVHIGAQAHLADWYARFGFVRSGPDYVEDGIPHLPMVRRAAGSTPPDGLEPSGSLAP